MLFPSKKNITIDVEYLDKMQNIMTIDLVDEFNIIPDITFPAPIKEEVAGDSIAPNTSASSNQYVSIDRIDALFGDLVFSIDVS